MDVFVKATFLHKVLVHAPGRGTKMTKIFKGIFLLLGSLLLVAAQNKRNDEKMKKQALKFHNYCTKKVDSNTEYLLAALYNNAEHTEPYKCYLQCIFDTLGLVDSDNQLAKIAATLSTQPRNAITNLNQQREGT
ncbi:odorant-binding protein 69a isoform 4-T5 [Glossina fuscipes fuscipes]